VNSRTRKPGGSGKGTLGKLFSDEELYNKANATVDKLNLVIDDLNAGKGSAGKFLKDPTLYNNANDTIANVKKLTDDINAGRGAIGKMAKDEEFAANSRILSTNSPPSPTAWKRAKARPAGCFAIPRSTPMRTRCSRNPRLGQVNPGKTPRPT